MRRTGNILCWGGRSSVLVLSALLLALLILPGCGDESSVSVSPPASQQVVKKAKPQPKPVPPTEEMVQEKSIIYEYDPSGRRDPFQPFTEIVQPKVQRQEPLTPLQKFEIGQLRLIAVIIGKGEPRAMIVAPDGKSYILKKGVEVGKNNGAVIDIEPEAVLIEERYFDFSGEVRTQIKEITLPGREGDE